MLLLKTNLFAHRFNIRSSSIQQRANLLLKIPTIVMNLIHQDFVDKKEVIKQKIVEETQMGYKFSLTHYEYTSLRHRRYISVNLHESEGKKIYKTSVIRIFGSCPAESLMQNVKDHLNSFGVCMERDIVGSTQDGAAINKKPMQLMNINGRFALIMQFLRRLNMDFMMKTSNLNQ